MNTALGVGGGLLAAVLAAAGLAKLFDLDGSRRAVEAFGVPARLARPLGGLLPLVELASAGLLAAGSAGLVAGWIGAIAALVLLGAFSLAIAASVLRGEAPD